MVILIIFFTIFTCFCSNECSIEYKRF